MSQSRIKRRLVIVQGTWHVLCATAILRYRTPRGFEDEFEDVLLMPLLVGVSKNPAIYNAVRELAEVWDWDRIVDFSEFEREVAHGTMQEWTHTLVLARALVGEDFDEVITSRNWLLVNEILLDAYPCARKIAYGDGPGIYDCFRSPWTPQFDEGALVLPHVLTSDNPSEHLQTMNELPGVHIPPAYLLEMIDRFLERQAEANWKKQLVALPENTVLLLCSPFAENHMMPAENEIQIGVEAVLEATSEGDMVLIKPHPKEACGQSKGIEKGLAAKGRKVQVFSRGDSGFALPIEVIHRAKPFQRVLAPSTSSSIISLKAIYGLDVDFCRDGSLADHLHEKFRDAFRLTCQGFDHAVRELDQWDGKSHPKCWHRPTASNRDFTYITAKTPPERLNAFQGGSVFMTSEIAKAMGEVWPLLKDTGNTDIESIRKLISDAEQSSVYQKESEKRLAEIEKQKSKRQEQEQKQTDLKEKLQSAKAELESIKKSKGYKLIKPFIG